MHMSRDGEPCHVEIFRRGQSEVIADGGDDQEPLPEGVQGILKASGFVEETVPPLYSWFQLPPNLGRREENARSGRALAALTEAGYLVAFDPDLSDDGD
ncbi:hypothetical protein [Streptomyces violaceusniger]|uniref:Uncharacterized protein n=1 Tax=Streptomyces violaceusniger TaxID=68280 RepID=A0A4D4LMT2_STRVO|nr:hypothetical protein SVIO_102600 [Streptomyces violaceusniger]